MIADDLHRRATPRWKTAAVAAAVFASFFAYSCVQATVPGPNEPHYLAKAKHHWDADFCPGDFFLDSSSPHRFFYQTVGLLTLFLSLEQTAWIGRILGYGLLAFGWTRFVSRFRLEPAAALWAAWVYLAVAAVGNLSGEWIVGGIESKVFTFGLLFLAFSHLADRRWKTAGALAGFAVAFHPVVGGWALIAGWASAAFGFFVQKQRLEPGERNRVLISAGLLVVCSLPGVIPALAAISADESVDSAKADRLIVYDRLAHHQDPTRFKKTTWNGREIEAAWIGYLFLTLFWLAARTRTERDGFERWFAGLVIAACLIAVFGLLVGWTPHPPGEPPDRDTPFLELRTTLLKFYPFRCCDAFVPIAAAIAFVGMLTRGSHTAGFRETDANGPVWRRKLIEVGLFSGFLAFALLHPIPDRNPSRMDPDEQRDWIAACRWIDENVDADAEFFTPAGSWAFKWYAQRAEYVSFKDCPQDAAGILEWHRRLEFVSAWSRDEHDRRRGYSRESFRKLLDEGMTHLIVRSTARGSIPFRPIHPTGGDATIDATGGADNGGASDAGFLVYRLRDAFPPEDGARRE